MMKMKGYLKTSEGLFQLSPKVTTIGREGCDLVIQVITKKLLSQNDDFI